MPNTLPWKSIVGVEFFKPLRRFLDLSRARRNCPALPDELWLEAGIRRCLGLFQSGRDFLQDLADRLDTEILRTTFFESLKSRRRLALLSEILAQVQVQAHMRPTLLDRFGWTVLPGDEGFPEIAEATPLEYLERWLNANHLLGDSARLRGISQTTEGVQIVISQPFIEGPYPQKDDIVSELRKYGFVLVPRFSIGSEADSSFYNDEKRLGIFDATCDNFILSHGTPIPVHAIIIPVGNRLRLQLRALIDH